MEGSYEELVEHAPDAVLRLDRDGKILSWNQGAVVALGFAAGEMIGRAYDALLPPGTTIAARLVEALAGGSAVHDLRTQRRRKDGRLIEVSLSRMPIPVERGGGGVEILRDITHHREIERELIETEKMAAVGKIASKVVHEIRNPLGSINLNVDMLLDHIGSEDEADRAEARDILQTIKRETRRLSQIAEEYLQFSRMPQPSGKEEDLNAVLLDLADFLRPELRRNGIRLVLNLDDRRPRVACDSRLLRQVVLNLIRNAMEAVPARSGQVMVVTAARENGGEIEVDDNGAGIAPEILPRIFEPFFTTKQDGTGLGLAVVRQILEEHGGTIDCKSRSGKGTTFRIWIPNATRHS
ncbi:MAG: PAS domain S-box protein [Candidatus Eisenbacteria bacterium]|nr:PAS domain S-box protein [Candidatus Latescibacterota bacterium]MBD3303278.1 PAS domain S-box protein [Candidatus Eisenbacteria bacterium]